ncbi:MAG: hypothetical protein KDE32_09245 [Novosphingobium sp.]|nr:hypothetical protein [Novosphingobium sp.]
MNLSIFPVHWRKGDEESFTVTLAIQEPQSACGANGVNSLVITRQMELAPGRSQVLEGPDGLTMRISRRK